MEQEFIGFPKLSRLSRGCTITEKIDGSNAQIYIGEDGIFLTGSRTRWITPNADGKITDNYGFAKWANENKEELMKLGPGRHFGEWWGQCIQRNYGLDEKRFSLFNAERWTDLSVLPKCCSVVPVLHKGEFSSEIIDNVLSVLNYAGSQAAPGFMKPEGIVIYHHASRVMYKKTLENDSVPKSLVEA